MTEKEFNEHLENPDSNLKIFLSEFEKLKGQFVITDMWQVERFVALAEDQWDYYYVTFDGRKLRWNTCVGKLVPLKGYIEDKDYENFIRIAKLNHLDQLDKTEFLKYLEEYLKENTREDDRFLTELCWDLN